MQIFERISRIIKSSRISSGSSEKNGYSFNHDEDDELKRIIDELNSKDKDEKNNDNKYNYSSDSSMSKYYKVLGLKQDADINTIKTTYKRLMKEFHPDKTSHLSPVERNKSEIRAKEINEAYNKIKKEKGF